MHQILSYETAVRANTSSEYREYVTKRTCVSLVLTIAFFTLISGYLLGNFVSERKNHIRMLLTKKPISPVIDEGKTNERTIDVSDADYMSLQELHANQKLKSLLLASAQKLSKLQQDANSPRLTSFNNVIYSGYISCTQDVPVNATYELSQFVETLIDNTAARQKDCFKRIQAIIDHNLTTM